MHYTFTNIIFCVVLIKACLLTFEAFCVYV